MKKTAVDMGGEVTNETELKASFGKGLMNTLKPWVPEGMIDEAIEQYMRNFHEIVGENIQLHDGVIELLDLLHERGIPMAVVTGNKMSEMEGIFSRLPLKKYFGAVVCADSIPYQKPSPEPVLEALRLLRQPIEGAVFIGEGAERHVAAIQAAGFPVESAHGEALAVGLLRYLACHADALPVADPTTWEPAYIRASSAERLWIE